MKFAAMLGLILAAILASTPVAAINGRDMPSQKSAEAKAVRGKGVVVSVNKAAGSLILKHEPIPALQWPAMTMSFQVKDKRQLNPLKKGDKVNFTLEQSGSEYVITNIK